MLGLHLELYSLQPRLLQLLLLVLASGNLLHHLGLLFCHHHQQEDHPRFLHRIWLGNSLTTTTIVEEHHHLPPIYTTPANSQGTLIMLVDSLHSDHTPHHLEVSLDNHHLGSMASPFRLLHPTTTSKLNLVKKPKLGMLAVIMDLGQVVMPAASIGGVKRTI